MWEYDTLDLLQYFAGVPLSGSSIKMFLEYFTLNMYESPANLKSATNLALVYGSSEYTFTSDDLVWLESADNAALCKGKDGNLIFVNLSVSPEEYYISSAAIVKLFDVIFPGNNNYIFKIENSLAFGCKRDFANQIQNNFCVTRLFRFEELKECVLFLEEALLYDQNDLPSIMIQYSPQENQSHTNVRQQNEINLDYLYFLQELNSTYGVDTLKERERYIGSFAELSNKQISYIDACTVLINIGENSLVTTYDILDDALHQESVAKTVNDIVHEEVSDDEGVSSIFSQEILMDAELLLHEMMKRDKLTD